MVDTKEYATKKNKYVNVQLIESLQSNDRRGVVMPGSDWSEWEGKDKKPYIIVSINREIFTWTLSRSATNALAEEFGTYETEKWVGGVIKFLIAGAGDKRYVTATMIQAPEAHLA